MNFSVLVLFQIALVHFVNGLFKDVATDQGIVRGYTLDADDVYSYYGIPYATAPTGEDRFKVALPPPTWDGVLNATVKQIMCPQATKYFYKTNMMTDCLRLDVIVPDTQETNLPVHFFIHGGGHQFGHPGRYSPLELVRQGMIVVFVNFRVGVLGFLCLNTEFAPGNAGMKDQVMAMRWVQRNIANFGGDPKKVTLGGISSGSSCVELQVLSPMSKGLIHRAMPVGGSGLADIAFAGEPLLIAEKHAKRFGVITNQNVSKLESFYRSLSDEQLEILYDSNFKEFGFSPCVETHNVPGVEKFLSEKPINILLSGNYEKIPIMSSFTPMEGLLHLSSYETWKPLMVANLTDFVPSSVPVEKRSEATKILRDFYFPNGDITYIDYIHFFSDLIYVYPMYTFARLNARNHALVYLNVYSYYNGTVNFPEAKGLPMRGPGHGMVFLLTQGYIVPSIYENMTEVEFVNQKKLTDLYSNFVKTGVPYSKLINVTWAPMSSSKAEYLEIDSDFHMEQFPLKDRMETWNSIYNYPYTDSATISTLSILTFVFCVLATIVFK